MTVDAPRSEGASVTVIGRGLGKETCLRDGAAVVCGQPSFAMTLGTAATLCAVTQTRERIETTNDCRRNL